MSDAPEPTSVRLDSETRFHVAIDLGAGSGRAFLGAIAPSPGDASDSAPSFMLEEVHRFHYAPRHADGRLRWDIARLFEGITTGIAHAQTRADALRAGTQAPATGRPPPPSASIRGPSITDCSTPAIG